MKGKRGDMEQLQSFIIYIIFVLLIFLTLLVFIRNAASGDLIKQQILAKQISLFIDSAEPNTEITIEKANFSVSIKENKVEVKSQKEPFGYSYYFFSKNIVETEEKENKIIIKILKND